MAPATQDKKLPAEPQHGFALNPHEDPVAYLQAAGWKCLGNPSWETARWLDPTKPLRSYYTEEECLSAAEVREEYVDPQDGLRKTRYRLEKRQVLCQDGRGGALQAARRQVFHPKGEPISTIDALRTQIERDFVEQEKAQVEREKEKSKK